MISNVVVDLIPLMIGAAVVPIWITIVLLLLRGEGGLPKAAAFVSGQTAVRLAQGIVFGHVFRSYAAIHPKEGTSAIVSTLMLVLGILLWITAVSMWRMEEDPEAPWLKWMARIINSVSAWRAFGLSALLIVLSGKQWIFTLGALDIISKSELGRHKQVIAYFIFVLGAQSLLLAPVLISAFAPKQSSHFLETSNHWLERNNRTIVIVVSVLLGSYFIFKGITSLLG
jgi:Sap, sulfolipid-1-addressing protein